MTVRNTARKQASRLLNRSAQQFAGLTAPSDGWVSLFRKALGMSGAQVARRMGLSRNAVYQAERHEREGAITLKQMEKLAEAMGGRFVYAVVPQDNVEEVIRRQARHKAEARIRRASAQMALESQALPEAELRERIDELAEQLIRDRPADFWDLR